MAQQLRALHRRGDGSRDQLIPSHGTWGGFGGNHVPLNGREQHVPLPPLGHDLGCTGAEGRFGEGWERGGRVQDDGRRAVSRFLTERPEDGQSVHVGQTMVQHDQPRRGLLAEELEGGGPVGDANGLVPAAFEQAEDEPASLLVVLDDQDHS